MTFKYRLYDLILEIPFPCPMLPMAPTDSIPDVILSYGPVPLSLPEATAEGNGWQANLGNFLFHGKLQVGSFLIQNGNIITLQRNPSVADDIVCSHLLASVIVSLIRQRGNQVLHATVIDTPRGAVAISGACGAGKSTTQAALIAHGCQMVTDDVAVLRLSEDSHVVALPGVPKMNLCDDTAITFGHDLNQLQRNPLRTGKVWVPVDHEVMVSGPVVLKTIYLLSCHTGKELIFTPLTGAVKFLSLQDCIYGPQLPEEHLSMFPLVSALAEQVDMVRIERPEASDSLNSIVESILRG